MSDHEEQNGRRLEAALLFRVLATFAVVLGHAASFFNTLAFTQWPNAPYIQSVAVIVFFCMWGYTIAWVCDRSANLQRQSAMMRFAFDRFMRLMIPLVPVLIIVTALEVAVLANDPYADSLRPRNVAGNLLFLQGLTAHIPFTDLFYRFGIVPVGVNRPLWTLSVEFWCYIALAAAFFAIRARSWVTLPLIVLALASLTLLMTFIITGGLPIIWGLGAALYFALKYLPAVSRQFAPAAACLALVLVLLACVPAVWPENGQYDYLFNTIIFGTFAAAMTAASRFGMNEAARKVVTALGDFAYTTYLVHYPVLFFLQDWGLLPYGSPTAALAGTAIAFLIAWLLSFPFERRYKFIREKIWNATAGIVGRVRLPG